MKLVLPSAKYKLSYLNLLNSARKYGDYKELGNAMIRDNESYDDLLNRLKDRRNGINIPEEIKLISFKDSNELEEITYGIEYFNTLDLAILALTKHNELENTKTLKKENRIY